MPDPGSNERSGFETLLTDLSARFAGATAETVDAEVVSAQRKIVETMDLDACTLGKVEGDRFVVTHFWNIPGLEPFPYYILKELPWFTSVMSRGDIIRFSSIDDLPEEAAREKELVRRIGRPRSTVTFPLMVGGNLVGGIGFSTVIREREWSDATVSRLRLLVDMIGGTMARIRAEVAMQEALEEVRRLRDQLRHEYLRLQQQAEGIRRNEGLIGESPAFRHVLVQVEQVAATNSNVLLIGETGTGKEMFASAIHDRSLRASRPMVRVSCAAIPQTLIESELFGREKGAYTGAMSRQVGRFELAHGSTLFLDEVGELPLEVQVKLLRVLEERKVERLGSSKSIPVDVRIIAATNRDLEKAVQKKEFRDDLFYRLNVFPIRTPPLRERPEDIPLLVQAFVHTFALSLGKRIEEIDRDSMEALRHYSWPGNIRELRNTVERAVILATGPHLQISLPVASADGSKPSLLHSDAEREHIRSVLEMTGWRVRGKGGAAEILGLKPTTLDSMIVRFGLNRRQNEKAS